ncbi:hypothetical protein Tco_0963940 [Tanacetum coccineum]
MSTSTTHQQSLADAGFETRPPMLEKGSCIPWASRYIRYLNRKRENKKWLNKEIDEGPYVFKNFTPKAMWQRVERLMRGIVQNKVDRETHFNNEFDQFVVEPGEALIFSRDMETSRKDFEKLANVSRAKKLEKSHDPLALVAHTGSSSRITSPYYVTHPSSVVDYDDDYQGDAVQNTFEDPLTSAMIFLARAITQRFSNPTNNRLRTSSNTKNQAIVQAVKVHDGRNTRRSYVQEEVIEGNNVQNDAGNIQRTLRTTSSGTATNV